MPIVNRQDAAEVDAYIQRIFDAPPAQRAQAIRRLFVEKLDFAGATGTVSLAKAPATVSLPPNAERIASLQGLNVVYVALGGDAKRVRKAEAREAAKLVSEQLGDVLLVFTNGTGSQLHFISPTFVGAAPSLRRMILERDLPRRTAVMQLSNVYWYWKDSGSISIAAAIKKAFDVEVVTSKFYNKYHEVFEKVEEEVTGFGADREKKRLFTQRLFNRLMFIAFIQRKGWLRIGGDKESGYLSALWEASRKDKMVTNFYSDRLKLVFAALNTEHGIGVIPGSSFLQRNIGIVRFVNGGLFDEKEDLEEEKAGIVVPDEAVKLILTDLFEPFNFTVMESSPLDVEVAVDPEMLGKVFEELVTGRHDTGSYYTPKPVVSFMAREAIKVYLQTACPAEARTAITAFVEEHKPDGLRDAEGVLAALKRVRVCDPACGSGAYLLGLLHELLDLRQALFATGSPDYKMVYDRKLEIIRHSLYGVDNDLFAVSIARLRLWLSLAVEFDGDAPPPLPNLDFKIEQGDSLSVPWPQGTMQSSLQDDLIKQFRERKGEYLTAHGGPKDALLKQIERLREEIRQWAHGKDKAAGFDWTVEFAEVFTDGGFDIAIANPPYRRQEGLGAEKLQLERLYPQVYASTADYHVYFYNRSVQLLRDGGVLSFITSNKYMRAGYGEKIRGFLPSTLTLSQAVDFGDLPVFTAAAYPTIVVGQKQPPKEGHSLRVADLAAPIRRYLTAQGKPVNRETVTAVMERLPVFLGESAVPAYPQALLRKSGWILEDPALVRLFDRLMSQGTPLGKFVNGRMYYGIKTGLNDAFVINEAKRQELIKADPRSAEVIKPWLRGRDIKRWRVEPAGLYVLFTRRGINIKQYPAIQEHLAKYRHPHVDAQGKRLKGLEPRGGKDYRKPGSYQWYEIQDNIAYYREFAEPKVVWPRNVDVNGMRFALDNGQALVNDKAYILPGAPEWLVALCNSDIAFFIAASLTTRLQHAWVELKADGVIDVLPIPSLDEPIKARLTNVAKNCRSHSKSDQELMATAVHAYGLNPKETELINAWKSRYVTAYGSQTEDNDNDAAEADE